MGIGAWDRPTAMFESLKQLHRRFLSGGAGGATLVEVLVSAIILGLLLAAMIPFAVFAQENEVRRNEIRIGESLSRNQLEYLKIQPYVWGNETWPPMLGYQEVTVPGAYAVRFYAVPIHIDPYTQGVVELYKQDEGVQKVTIQVFGWRNRPDPSLGSRMVFETSGYKVAPSRSLEITKYEVSREVVQ